MNPISAAVIQTRLAAVHEQIAVACQRCGRDPASVDLVAVCKTASAAAVQQAAEAGQYLFGENRVQEAAWKQSQLPTMVPPLRWHLIGPLQRNKVKQALSLFDVIHSVDSLALAEEINRQRAQQSTAPMPVLIQVNIGREPQKHGLMPEAAMECITAMAQLPHIAIGGLMAIPPFHHDPEQVRPWFRQLADLSSQISSQAERLQLARVTMRQLSMGMSHDFTVAIEEGATLVRVGTAIFAPESLPPC
ncbi:MAG: YggS family pyridoxal phosphate-dependent enzyme [Magnetococcales bacterium]|nr:YggS family pyridoxal phosphate-dependent enzyme [Magnetococcales bacterium]